MATAFENTDERLSPTLRWGARYALLGSARAAGAMQANAEATRDRPGIFMAMRHRAGNAR